MHSRAWLELHDLGGDFYDGALERIRCPVLVVHGACDPHTPVEEIEELLAHLPGAEVALLDAGGHSPHSEPATARAVTDRVAAFLRTLGTPPNAG
jgi:pimeloyl-ACP methyl ester carboxylesterase